MDYALLIFTILAVVLHVFIFYLETIAWTSPLARRTFGLDAQEAELTKSLAANQGVYNLLLAIIALVGVVVYIQGSAVSGLALILAGCGSMSLAAVYLFVSSNKKQAALKQLLLPAISAVLAVILLI